MTEANPSTTLKSHEVWRGRGRLHLPGTEFCFRPGLMVVEVNFDQCYALLTSSGTPRSVALSELHFRVT